MAADSENASIYNLLINSDPEVVSSLTEQLNELTAKGMSINEAFEQINASAGKASNSVEQMATRSTEGFGAATTSVKSLNEQLAEAIRQSEKLASEPVPFRETATEYRFGTAVANPQGGDMGGSYAGGGPEVADQIPGQGASGGTGSLFGVGRALSVAGFMTGIPGLKEAGAFVYIEEGFKRVLPLAQQFGETIANSSPGISSFVAGLTGLSAPMAGLLSVVGPIAIAVGGLVIGMSAYNNAVEEASNLLKGLIAGQDEYYSFIQKATTQEAKDKVQSLEDNNKTTKQKLDENVGIIKKYLLDTQGASGVPLGEGKDFLKNLKDTGLINAIYDPAVQAAVDAAQKYADEINKNDIFIGRLTGDLQSNSLAANDAAEAAKKATQASIDKATNDAVLQRQFSADMNLAPDAAKKRLEYLQQEGPIIQGQMAALQPLIATNEEAKKQYDALNTQLQNNVAEIQFLNGVAIPAAQHTKDMADAVKELDDALKKSQQGLDAYNKTVTDTESQLAQQKADATAKEKEQEAALTVGSIQDTYQRSQIKLAESRKEVTLANDTFNAITDARTKLNDKEKDALTNYNRQLLDDQTKYQQDVQKDQMATYRTERDNYQSHAEKLASIEAKVATDQQDALLNRNFLALAKQQQGHQSSIDAENTAYAQQQAKAQQHLQDQLADLAIHQAELRANQRAAYDRKLADDQTQTNREIGQKLLDEQRKMEVLRTTESQQLQDLTTTEAYKIQILRQGFAQEIAMYELQAQRRIQVAAQTQQEIDRQTLLSINALHATNPAASDQAMGTYAAQSLGNQLANWTKKLKLFDTGGSFGAGDTFMKGSVPEIMSFGSNSYAIPGAAIIHPLQGGSATPMGGGGNNITIPITISRDSKDPAREASQLVYDKLQDFFGNT